MAARHIKPCDDSSIGKNEAASDFFVQPSLDNAVAETQRSHQVGNIQLVEHETHRSWQLVPGKSITIGRYIACDIVIEVPIISGKHCMIQTSSSMPEMVGLEVLALGANGTFVNRSKVTNGTWQKLNVGDEIALATIDGPRFDIVHANIETSERSPSALQTRSAIQSDLDAPSQDSRGCNSLIAPTWQLVDEQTGDAYSLLGGTSLTLGSDGGCEIVIDVEGVRCEHCKIIARDMKRRRLTKKTCAAEVPAFSITQDESLETPLKILVELQNLGGAKGTYVNNDAIGSAASTWLKAGDAIALGAKGGPRFLLEYANATPTLSRHNMEREGATSMQMETLAAVDETPPSKSQCNPQPLATPPKTAEDVAICVEAALQNCSEGDRCLVDLISGFTFSLPEVGVVTLGRRADCDVVVNSVRVSGRHCILLCQDCRTLTLEDVSTNGTFINGTLVPQGAFVPQRIPLRHGDVLSLADDKTAAFVFLAPSGKESNSTIACSDE